MLDNKGASALWAYAAKGESAELGEVELGQRRMRSWSKQGLDACDSSLHMHQLGTVS